jgi:hypothetical protein
MEIVSSNESIDLPAVPSIIFILSYGFSGGLLKSEDKSTRRKSISAYAEVLATFRPCQSTFPRIMEFGNYKCVKIISQLCHPAHANICGKQLGEQLRVPRITACLITWQLIFNLSKQYTRCMTRFEARNISEPGPQEPCREFF